MSNKIWDKTDYYEERNKTNTALRYFNILLSMDRVSIVLY